MHTPPPSADIVSNAAWQDGPAKLSVLIPFFKDDPAHLLRQLDRQSGQGMQIILYDDGSQDAVLTAHMLAVVQACNAPVQLITADDNHGRSHARNALIEASTGAWVLFLDADMMPQDRAFLPNWLNCIETNNPAIAFGGFNVEDLDAVEPALALHQAFSKTSDCLPAHVRAQNPAKHVCTSNLLVRRDVLGQCPFDNGFAGWGWEDVEWAARAADKFSIVHIDNAAVHLGLENADTLVRRFKDSAGNYARFVERHPDLARTLPSWRSAQMIKKIPYFSLLRPLFAAIARQENGFIPLQLRTLALKLWRSSWYAQALS